jgi:hypothetical protein
MALFIGKKDELVARGINDGQVFIYSAETARQTLFDLSGVT